MLIGKFLATLMEEGGELQWGRARQGVVPDFKFMLNTPDGPMSSLAELKGISAGKTRYPRGVVGKGTDRRAALIAKEYETNLRRYNVMFHGAAPLVRGQPEPPAGPLVQRLRSFPMQKLVAGPWGDLSQDFHQLLSTFAKSRAEASARSRGREGGAGKGELGKVMGEVRRAMSVQVVRSQALCLLERLAQLGPALLHNRSKNILPRFYRRTSAWPGQAANIFDPFFDSFLDQRTAVLARPDGKYLQSVL